MIDSDYIEAKWSTLDKELIKGYRAIRLSNDCTPELNIGYNEKENRCLILELPASNYFDISPVTKQNIILEYFKDVNYVVIELINPHYIDLFSDLVLSIYIRIKKYGSPKEYVAQFLNTYVKWTSLFETHYSKKLSEEKVQGLFGELFTLKNLISNTYAHELNLILKSWKGPYDRSNDFEFEEKNIEVKTKQESTRHVRISSEFQLDAKGKKDLDLLIITVRSDYTHGVSVHDLLMKIKNVINSQAGDLSILYTALKEMSLTCDNLKNYNNYRYSVIKTESFNAGHNDFPKLIASRIDESISKLKYNLNVRNLSPFLIREQKFVK